MGVAGARQILGSGTKCHCYANLVNQVARHRPDNMGPQNAICCLVGQDFHKAVGGKIRLGTSVAHEGKLANFVVAPGFLQLFLRLANHGNDIGTLDELRVIAAAVIGGTALSGGVGTIYGAILGALVMQSLQSGMAMVGVDAPLQNIVVGAVLVAAVLIDIIYRRRAKDTS